MTAKRLALAMALLLCAAAPPAWARTPYSESELRSQETSDEAKIRELRNQEITQLRITLGRRPPAHRRADLYMRLAEIYVEAYRADYLLEGRAHERRLERGQQDRGIDHSRSRPHLSNGIKACQEILRLRVPVRKMDEIYYFLGFNYSELGDTKLGLRWYEKLAREFPSSRFVTEAYKELGDASFDDGKFRKAQDYYERAIRKGGDEALPRIYHKLAWSYYRTKQFGRAVETMKLAVSSAQKSGEKFLSLREEALRDMAIFMTETGQVDEALAYFQGVAADKQFYPRILEKLGRQYERNVEPAKAAQVYESLLRTNPDSEAGFRVLVKLVDLDLRRGRHREALARVNAAKVPAGGEHETQVAAQNLRAMVRRTATESHEKFRKTSARPSLEIAEAYYTAYLNRFLAGEDPRNEVPEIRMYLAEVKRELGKSQEASDLYRKVVDSRDKRYAKEAGALWTASLSEAIRKSAGAGKISSKASEPSKLELEFVDAADRLQEALGDTNDARESALRAAEVLGGYKETHGDAIKRSRKIISRWPKSPQAVTAARLWLQLLAEGDPDDLRDAVKEIRGNDALMAADRDSGGKLRAWVNDHDTRARIEIIAKEEKSGDFEAAGKHYESFAADSSQRDVAEKAYANALTSYAKAGEAAGVERVAQQWAKRYPKSPRALEAIRAGATQLLVAGRFEQSAGLFALVGRDAGDPGALETAIAVSEGAGDAARAQQLRLAFLEAHGRHPRRGAVLLAFARYQDASGQDSQAAASYKNCASSVPELEAECSARLAELYLKAQNVSEAKAQFRKAGAAGRRSKSPYVGYARYRLAELMEREARFDRMEMPAERLKAGLNQRMQFLEPLSRAYTSAVEAGGPWAVAALERLASWVMQFADEVDAITPPAGADAAAVAQFRKNLQSVSGPLRKRAVTAWAQGYSKASAAEALSPALPLIADRLADARASHPRRAQGYRGRFRLGGIAPDGGELSRGTAFEKTRERLFKNLQDSAAWVDYGNLLWGDGKPLLSRIAYDRALALSARNPAALNNRGVVAASGEGEESWHGAAEAAALFADALRHDDFYLPAKFNRALLFNYYRLFDRARPYWEQVLAKAPGADAHDGLGVALQGMGHYPQAEAQFDKASDAGGSGSRFARVYHEAARASTGGSEGAARCLKLLGDVESGVAGFEKEAVERLRKTCASWKGEDKT